MSNFNTGNPVPSSDPRDLDDNATIFDRLVNEHIDSVLDRTGVLRKTYWRMEQDAAALSSPNTVALAALTGVANRVLMFTGPGTMTSIASGTVGQNILAAETQAEGRAALGISSPINTYGPSNILGPVSQSGGVPTGAIIERTAGANGDCVRFADGTQICTWRVTVPGLAITTASGALWRSANFVGTTSAFAKPFISPPAVTVAHFANAWYGFLSLTSIGTAANWPSLAAFSVASTTTDITYNAIAIGRWF